MRKRIFSSDWWFLRPKCAVEEATCPRTTSGCILDWAAKRLSGKSRLSGRTARGRISRISLATRSIRLSRARESRVQSHCRLHGTNHEFSPPAHETRETLTLPIFLCLIWKVQHQWCVVARRHALREWPRDHGFAADSFTLPHRRGLAIGRRRTPSNKVR